MTPALPRLAGLDTATASRFARGRVLAWRTTCQGPQRPVRFSLVRCAEVSSRARAARDAAWWEIRAGEVALDSVWDPADRLDVALRLLAALDDPPVVAVWSRVGPNEPTQSDLGWWAALRHAAGDRDVAVPSLLVVTRWGWRCLPEGTSRTWKRLRNR